MLLDPVVRGNFISSYDSFESLIDNPYVEYQPVRDEDEMARTPQEDPTEKEEAKRMFLTQQSPIITNLEQGNDVTQDLRGNQRISSLMEPLIEQEEDEKVADLEVKNRASTCTSFTVNSHSQPTYSESSESLQPEGLFLNNFSPSTQELDH